MNGGDSSDPVGGSTLVEALKTQATALDKILTDQKTLFDDIDDALDEDDHTLLKTQGDSLDKIDGEKLLDIFDTVDAT